MGILSKIPFRQAPVTPPESETKAHALQIAYNDAVRLYGPYSFKARLALKNLQEARKECLGVPSLRYGVKRG